MKLQPDHRNNIVYGMGQIMGAVTEDGSKPAWVLPGKRYTTSKNRAMEVAKRIDKLIRSSALN